MLGVTSNLGALATSKSPVFPRFLRNRPLVTLLSTSRLPSRREYLLGSAVPRSRTGFSSCDAPLDCFKLASPVVCIAPSLPPPALRLTTSKLSSLVRFPPSHSITASTIHFSASVSQMAGPDADVSATGSTGGATVDIAKPKASLSRRIESTDEPIIYQMARIIEGSKDVLSLGQGVVHWLPPASALKAAEEAVSNPKCSGYGIDDGIPELRNILVEKIRAENGLMDSSVMVTAGANQAFVNVVMAVCDPDDTVVLFQPYYFNHLMAFQMSGVTKVLHGKRDPTTMHPDVEWVREALSGKHGPVPKVIVVTNPDNPTGTFVPEEELRIISDLCAAAGSWLVLDNTYEYFMYGGRKHVCLEAPHVINIFSFSKAYGMMGWRVGYIAYPNSCAGLGGALVKAQDTIPICANLVGQFAAVAAAKEGRGWVLERVKQLDANLDLARDALSPLGPDAIKGGEGAIYLWGKLPPQFQDDRAVVQWLVKRHGVIVIPGSASGAPGHFRISFANLPAEKYKAAAERLKSGLLELISKGFVEE